MRNLNEKSQKIGKPFLFISFNGKFLIFCSIKSSVNIFYVFEKHSQRFFSLSSQRPLSIIIFPLQDIYLTYRSA